MNALTSQRTNCSTSDMFNLIRVMAMLLEEIAQLQRQHSLYHGKQPFLWNTVEKADCMWGGALNKKQQVSAYVCASEKTMMS